jgi:hypothetical protein
MPLYLGDAIDLLFGKDTEKKAEFRKTTDALKSLGWAFESFEEGGRQVHFSRGEWKLTLKA